MLRYLSADADSESRLAIMAWPHGKAERGRDCFALDKMGGVDHFDADVFTTDEQRAIMGLTGGVGGQKLLEKARPY